MIFNSRDEAQEMITSLGIALCNFDNIHIAPADEDEYGRYIIMATDKNGFPIMLEEEDLP